MLQLVTYKIVAKPHYHPKVPFMFNYNAKTLNNNYYASLWLVHGKDGWLMVRIMLQFDYATRMKSQN